MYPFIAHICPVHPRPLLSGFMDIAPGDTDDDENSDHVTVPWTDFDVLCGCTPSSSPSDSPAPYPASTPSPFASTSYPPASTSHSFECGGAKDQFQITSAEVREIYGECFTAANASSSNDMIIYTPDGTRNVGQFFVAEGDLDGNVSLTYNALDHPACFKYSRKDEALSGLDAKSTSLRSGYSRPPEYTP